MVISVYHTENSEPICRWTDRCNFDHDKSTHVANTKRTEKEKQMWK